MMKLLRQHPTHLPIDGKHILPIRIQARSGWGGVPEHWDVKKLKYLVSSDANSFVDGPFGSDLKNEEYKDDGVPLIQLNNIIPGKHVLKNTKYISEEKAQDLSRHVILSGQIVIAKMAEPVARASCVNSVYSKYVIVADCVKFNPNDELAHIPFLVYSINSSHVRHKAELLSTGTTRLRINLGSIKNLSLLFPPIPEQRAIATFLDRKTSRIDTLISKKQRLITLLHEKRAALISHTVTKGLDPDVPMKDSGVEWLGEIPAHWDIWKINHAFRCIGSGTTPSTNDMSFYNGDIPWVITSELRENIINDTVKKITQLALEEHPALEIYPPGSLLIAMYGATIGRLGILGISACTNQACCVFTNSISLDIKFTFYWLWMRRQEIIVLSSGGGQPNINQEKLKDIRIPAPLLPEQHAIASSLDSETAKIDALISKIQEAIKTLKEYRTALISAAVTGKIDVRNENRN